MRYFILLLFSAIFYPFSRVAADSPVAPSLQSLKVSEINANLFSVVYDFLYKIGNSILEAITSLKDFVDVGEWIILAFRLPETQEILLKFSLQLFLTLLITGLLTQGLSLLLKRKLNSLLACKESPPFKKVFNLGRAVILATLPPLCFGFFFYTLSRILNPHNDIYLAIAYILSSGTVTIWVFLNILHLFLRSPSPAQQHLPLSREVLKVTYLWARRTALVALLGFFVLKVGDLIDLPLPGQQLLLQATAFVVSLLTIFMGVRLFYEIKKWVSAQQKKRKLSTFEKAMLPYLSYSYLPFVIFIAASYMSWATHIGDPIVSLVWKGLITLIMLPLARAVAVCLRRLRIYYLRKYFKSLPEAARHWLLRHSRKINFVSLSLLNILAVFLTLKLWGLDPMTLLLSTFGKVVLERGMSILMIIVIALMITRAGERVLTRYLTSVKESENTAKKQKMARFQTIYSVSRNVLRILVWTPAIVLITIELNLNVVPLLTTVGIFSVGLSFGVQSLVKDFVTGFFMLLEDAFAVGDLVLINGQLGRIESLTVRVVRVRSTDGSLHTFPYGNITTLSNQNRDYSAAILLFRVGFKADLNQVFEILKKIAQDLSADPLVRKLITGPLRIDGINAISDHDLEVRAVLKTQPGEYDKVRWAFNRLLKQYLEAEKIPAATPQEISFTYPIDNKEIFF